MAATTLFGFILSLLAVSKSHPIHMAPLSPLELKHTINMDQMGDFILKWTPGDDDIIFEVHVATTGYIGLGFSTNGGMKNSDIVIGGVDDETGDVYLTDRFAPGYGVPKIDDKQDVVLLEGFQNESHTSLRFSRPWYTCDLGEDLELSKDDTVRLIWAYGGPDPKYGDQMALQHHRLRGTRSIYLNEPVLQMPEFGDDVKVWEVRSPNITLPDDLTTLYWCKLFKIPPLTKKTHVIGYLPVIAEDNIQHVHHLLLYECHIPDSEKYFEKWIDMKGAQCFGRNMPNSWNSCGSPMATWAVGNSGSLLPEHVGFPLGEEHGGATYFMMEMHYDNPNLRKGIVDNSGLRILYTEKLRPYDAGVLMMGHRVTPLQIIPQGQQWITSGVCNSECTSRKIPEKGIKAFAGVLHSHLLGRNLTLRHIRNNKELPVIIKDVNYDFNFQEYRTLKKAVTILPGDELITECGLDSRDRDSPSFGGFGTEEEMCLSFLYYYPRIELAYCASNPNKNGIFENLGIEDILVHQPSKSESTDENGIDVEAELELAEGLKAGDIDDRLMKLHLSELFFTSMEITAPARYRNKTFHDIVASAETWKDPGLTQRYQEFLLRGDIEATCNERAENLHETEPNYAAYPYPKFKPLPSVEDNRCSNGN